MIHLISDSYPELQIVLFGTVADKQLSNYIIENCSNSKMHDMTGKTSIKSLAFEFANCSLVLGCDSGAVHLSSAVGTPTLTIFGPTNSVVTAPCFAIPKINHGADTRGPMLNSKPQDVLKSFHALIKKSKVLN